MKPIKKDKPKTIKEGTRWNLCRCKEGYWRT